MRAYLTPFELKHPKITMFLLLAPIGLVLSLLLAALILLVEWACDQPEPPVALGVFYGLAVGSLVVNAFFALVDEG